MTDEELEELETQEEPEDLEKSDGADENLDEKLVDLVELEFKYL